MCCKGMSFLPSLHVLLRNRLARFLNALHIEGHGCGFVPHGRSSGPYVREHETRHYSTEREDFLVLLFGRTWELRLGRHFWKRSCTTGVKGETRWLVYDSW